jgi:hypothetical protein
LLWLLCHFEQAPSSAMSVREYKVAFIYLNLFIKIINLI